MRTMFSKWMEHCQCEQYASLKGWLAVVGGVLVHLSLGTIYTIGIQSVEVAGHFIKIEFIFE